MTVVIRSADLTHHNDQEAVWLLLSTYAAEPVGGGTALPIAQKPELLRQLALWQSDRGAVILVAWQGDEAVGLLNAFEGFSTFAAQPLLNVHDLVVHSAARRRGVGTALLDALAHLARERGCIKLTLEVLARNQSAQLLYQRVGFRPYALNEQFGAAQFWQKPLVDPRGEQPTLPLPLG